MLIFIVLNIFLMLFSSVAFEYIDLEKRLNNITTVVNEAGESAVNISTKSEELFTSKYLDNVTSYGIANPNCPIHKNTYYKVSTNTLLFDNLGNAHKVGAYALAVYYCKNNEKMPTTLSDFNELDRLENSLPTEDIYEFLFGEDGTEFFDDNLIWANKNSSIYIQWHNKSVFTQNVKTRLMNTKSVNAYSNTGKCAEYNDFDSFAKHVYNTVYTNGILKEYNSDYTSNYNLDYVSYPALLNMGLKFRSNSSPSIDIYNSSNSKIKKVSSIPWNTLLSTTSKYTNDYFVSSFHVGKVRQFGAGRYSSRSGSMGGMYSKYFLTPHSLGVTYVPLSVLKPNFIALLKTKIQLNKVSGGEIESAKDLKTVIQESIGCLDTDVYDTTSGVVANESQKHVTDSDEDIINDGDIEYDLNSIKVKVEYFDCDFYNEDEIDEVINRIEGAVPYQSLDSARKNLVDTETRYNKVMVDGKNLSGKRVVAKVTYKIKVHVPYHSTILQLMCHKDSNSAHYDIRRFIPDSNDVVRQDENANYADMKNSDVWYQYTTYCSVTR